MGTGVIVSPSSARYHDGLRFHQSVLNPITISGFTFQLKKRRTMSHKGVIQACIHQFNHVLDLTAGVHWTVLLLFLLRGFPTPRAVHSLRTSDGLSTSTSTLRINLSVSPRGSTRCALLQVNSASHRKRVCALHTVTEDEEVEIGADIMCVWNTES